MTQRAHTVRWLVGSTAYNVHIQNIARAIYEADDLYEFRTGGVDNVRWPPLRWARQGVSVALPGLDRQLSRRQVSQLPPEVVRANWLWELPRVLASRLTSGESLEDWLWERSEKALDRNCARIVCRPDVGGFLGVEHGALASLRAARALGKPGVVAYLSPHHRTRAKWVDVEFDRDPALLTPGRARSERLAPLRDERRDEEATTATWIETGSTFTTRSLVDAGLPPEKILTVPMGGPDPISERSLPTQAPSNCRFAYVGPVSVRKGAHYLLRAWNRISGRGAQLHLYGKVLLSSTSAQLLIIQPRGAPAAFHGSVPSAELHDVYLQSSVLVLPTLCDGFGMVVAEALAHGLPVITTSNAGAADLVEHGRTGFVIPPANEDALSACMQWCVDNPAALFAMRRAALAAAARWTWADFRRRHTAVLNEALGTGVVSDAPGPLEGCASA